MTAPAVTMADHVMLERAAMSTALTLRPYQQEAIEAIEGAVERGVQRPLLVLPTGCTWEDAQSSRR